MATSRTALVIVEWLDAWVRAGDMVTLNDVADNHAPEHIRTIGWLLRQDETGVSIANEDCGDGNYRGRSFIPQAMITSISPLTLTKPRKKKEAPCATSEPSVPLSS